MGGSTADASQPARVFRHVASPAASTVGLSASGTHSLRPTSPAAGLSTSGIHTPHHAGAVPSAVDGSVLRASAATVEPAAVAVPNIGPSSLRSRAAGSSASQPSAAAHVASTMARFVLPKARTAAAEPSCKEGSLTSTSSAFGAAAADLACKKGSFTSTSSSPLRIEAAEAAAEREAALMQQAALEKDAALRAVREQAAREHVSRTVPEERVIVVKYDDTRWTGTYSHGLRGSPVRMITEKKKQVHAKPSSDPRVDAEQRHKKRLARLARQLGE